MRAINVYKINVEKCWKLWYTKYSEKPLNIMQSKKGSDEK